MAVTKYSAPDAGDGQVPGGYGAPTPHANTAQQTPYEAPTGMSPGPSGAGHSAHGGFDAMEQGLGMPAKTPMEMHEAPEPFDVS